MSSSAEKLTPAPQAPPDWTQHTPDSIVSITKSAIERSRALQDTIGARLAEQQTFDNVVEALAQDEAALDIEADHLTFYQYVSPDKTLRDASVEADRLIREFYIESSARKDIYLALQAAERNTDLAALEPEQKRLLEKMLLNARRAGLALPDKKREKLVEIKKKISDATLAFSKNFNEEKGTIAFTRDELEGVPEDVVNGYSKEEGTDKLAVTFKTPDILPVFKYARNADTRRRAYEAFEARLAINTDILAETVRLRREHKNVLGYKTHADYVIEPKMAKTAENVNTFLADLREKLTPVGKAEREKLLKLKNEDGDSDPEFWIHDYRYLDRLFIEKTLDLDDAEVKKYFPVNVVVKVILDLYQDLLQVRFELVPDAKVWHPDVQQFAVWSTSEEKEFLGYMHLDLFPRDNKYSHAAVWGLVPGCTKLDGTRQYPVAAMVANLAKPTPGKPALMPHNDVVTFFHEMGHAFHQLCSKTRYARFHGTHVARDFVEAPSQMLENWCWEPKELKRMSSHYETQQPLPDKLIERIIKSRFVNQGLANLRQLFFASYDMKVHTSEEELDMTALWDQLREEISLVKSSKAVPGQSSFGHISSGYDAGYYGYLYSQVFSADMYETVFSKDPMSPEAGARYRRHILLPGGSRDEMDLLKSFLGREPTSDAFLKKLLGGSAESLQSEGAPAVV